MQKDEYESKFKGLWVPRELFEQYDLKDGTNLGWLPKLVFLEIHSFKENSRECFFSNAFIAKKYNISIRQASKIINLLIENGFIELVKFNGKKRYLRSIIEDSYKAKS